MKKIFCIIAAVIIAFVGILLTVFGSVRKTLSFNFNQPYSINVYYKSSTTINGGESYYPDDAEYANVIEKLGKSTKASLLTLLLRTGSVKYNIEYGSDNYATYDTSMKGSNIVVELIYNQLQNVIVYENGNTRVVAYTCLLFIIPCESRFTDIIVYNSYYNDSTLKENEYKEKTPFVIKGNPKKLMKYLDTVV